MKGMGRRVKEEEKRRGEREGEKEQKGKEGQRAS